MSKIRLYLDEDIQEQALILALRNSGVDVISCVASRLPMVLERERGRRGEGERI